MKKFALLASLLCSVSAQAAEYKIVHMQNGDVLAIEGDINYGEETVFEARLAEIAKAGRAVTGIGLNSPGGNVYSAEAMAGIVAKQGYAVMVADGDMCASSCFLILAAGKEKLVMTNARIGVHGASMSGKEDTAAAKVTLLMIADLKEYGVPPAILGKLAMTGNSEVSWLDSADLRSMGVDIVPTKPKAAAAPAAAPAPVSNVVNWSGPWVDYAAQAVRWSKESYGKHDITRTAHKDGSYLLTVSYVSKTKKKVELVENHTTGADGEFDAWTCVHYSDDLKKCRGWGVEKWDTYNKVNNRWVKQ
jgi:hypothetical protein